MFLGLYDHLKPKDWSFRKTWENYPYKQELWVGMNNEHEEMHLQGRRWGTRIYKGAATSKSYSVEHGDRQALLQRIPYKHIQFFREATWVLESDKFIFVHAGFENDKPLRNQIESLVQQDVTIPRVPCLSNRTLENRHGHPETKKCIVSGHVQYDAVQNDLRRILCDTTGGKANGNFDENSFKLSAVILPERKIVQSD